MYNKILLGQSKEVNGLTNGNLCFLNDRKHKQMYLQLCKNTSLTYQSINYPPTYNYPTKSNYHYGLLYFHLTNMQLSIQALQPLLALQTLFLQSCLHKEYNHHDY